VTYHSPQAEAAALIAKARKYDANTRERTGQTTTVYGQLADALEKATAALAVKREADREAVFAVLDSHQEEHHGDYCTCGAPWGAAHVVAALFGDREFGVYEPGVIRGAPAKVVGPPDGWFGFGTHIEFGGPLEFSDEVDDSGMPKWERHVEAPPVEVTEAMAEAVARIIANAACDWIDRCDDDDHPLGHSNWEAYMDDARTALRAALGAVEPKPAPETPDLQEES